MVDTIILSVCGFVTYMLIGVCVTCAVNTFQVWRGGKHTPDKLCKTEQYLCIVFWPFAVCFSLAFVFGLACITPFRWLLLKMCPNVSDER